MQRAILPVILATLGFLLLKWALTLPLLEWEITSVKADYPPTYKAHLDPSPWIAKPGESLDDQLYIFHKVWVSIDQNTCMNIEELNIAAERSPTDERIESLFVKISNMIAWLDGWGFVLIIVSAIFLWWILVRRERHPISDAVYLMVIIALPFCLIGIMRLLGPKISTDYFLVSYECHGALTFRAELAKIHYETLAVLLAGIFAEFGALGMMVYEIIRIMIQGSGSSKWAVG